MSRFYGKHRFRLAVLRQCKQQMAVTALREQEEMARQKAAELEEIRQAKKERARQRNSDRVLTKARRLAWERKYKEAR